MKLISNNHVGFIENVNIPPNRYFESTKMDYYTTNKPPGTVNRWFKSSLMVHEFNRV